MLRVTVPMASTGGAESTSGRHAPQQPATLFSNGHVRADVAVQVSGGCQITASMFVCKLHVVCIHNMLTSHFHFQLLTCSQDIIEGFELSKEIIQVNQMPGNHRQGTHPLFLFLLSALLRSTDYQLERYSVMLRGCWL